jgi:hypothetical protein
MRRFVLALVCTGAVLTVGATAALGAAHDKHCGTLYKPACTPPHVDAIAISVECHPAGTVIALAKTTVTSNAGLTTVTITVHSTSKVIKEYKHLNGALELKVKNVSIDTDGFSSGVHTITITAVDELGKKGTKSVHFAICVPPPPPFTG